MKSKAKTTPKLTGCLAELYAALGQKLRVDLNDRILYRYDALLQGDAPLAVVMAETTEDVAHTLRICYRHNVPVVPRGGASGLSGGCVPSADAVVISTTKMLDCRIDAAAMTATVQPGVINQALQDQLKPLGLYYPPDPQSGRQATIGGNIAENAGGPQCLKKGVTGDYVLELEFITMDGAIYRMDRSGLDLPGVIIGSEGTLAFVTEAKLRLATLPKYVRSARAIFAKLEDAGQAVALITSRGLTPSKLELMDKASLNAVEDAFQLGLPRDAEAILVCDCDGDDASTVQGEIEAVKKAFDDAGATQSQIAQTPKEADQLWFARRSISPSLGRIKPQRMNEDIVVPRSKLPEVMREIRALGDASGLPLAVFGHAGDGNLHPNILYDKREGRWDEVDALAHKIAQVAIRYGGVLSGEHGIGLAKKPFMTEATPAATMQAYWAVKHAFDPKGLLNPGKVLPDLPDKPSPWSRGRMSGEPMGGGGHIEY